MLLSKYHCYVRARGFPAALFPYKKRVCPGCCAAVEPEPSVKVSTRPSDRLARQTTPAAPQGLASLPASLFCNYELLFPASEAGLRSALLLVWYQGWLYFGAHPFWSTGGHRAGVSSGWQAASPRLGSPRRGPLVCSRTGGITLIREYVCQ